MDPGSALHQGDWKQEAAVQFAAGHGEQIDLVGAIASSNARAR
jgi:hypothetical protein